MNDLIPFYIVVLIFLAVGIVAWFFDLRAAEDRRRFERERGNYCRRAK